MQSGKNARALRFVRDVLYTESTTWYLKTMFKWVKKSPLQKQAF